MQNVIMFEYNGEEFTLEFDRESARNLARRGFSVDRITQNPFDNGPQLFRGAIDKHHKHVSTKKTDAIYESFEDKSELIVALIEMYSAVIEDVLSNEGATTKWERVGK